MLYFVHRYDVVRIKVAVEAEDHEDAMKKADALLAKDHPVRDWSAFHSLEEEVASVTGSDPSLLPRSLQVEEAGQEVTGYLVDEVGDEEGYANSRSCGPDFKPVERADG